MGDRGGQRLPVVREVSAGGVVFRRGEGGTEVALIATRGHSRWQLPKGLVEPGETAEAAAAREVSEETGLFARVLAPIETVEFWYVWGEGAERARHHKRVRFFLCACTGGDLTRHDREVDEARWFPIDQAMARVTFANERDVLRRAQGMIEGLAES